MCKHKDHCGPMIVNFKTWFLSKLVPDTLWGVDISRCCRLHDEDYTRGGTEKDRLIADTRFKERIFNKIYRTLYRTGDYEKNKKFNKGVLKKASRGSTLYFLGVRVGGSKQFNYREPEK
jgi:hypothetical protein